MKLYKYLTAVSALVLILAVSTFCSARTEGNTLDKATAEPAVSTSVLIVQPTEIPIWTEYSGRLEAIEQVEVRSRVSGPVTAVYFTEGSTVRQGDPLFQIDPKPYQANVRAAQARLSSARVQAKKAETEWKRAQSLVQSRMISQQQADELMYRHQEAVAAVRTTEAELETRKLELDYTTVKAPIDGRIGARRITLGNLVEAGPSSAVLAVITQLDPIYASFDVDDKFVSQLLPLVYGDNPHNQVHVQLDSNGKVQQGRLQLVENQLDNRTGTLRIRAEFSNADNLLLAGQFVRVRMALAAQEQQISVDPTAIGTNQDQRFVMTLDDNNQAVYTEVELGAQVNGNQIILNGLREGDRVLKFANNKIKTGTMINPLYQTVDTEPSDEKTED